MAMQAGLSAGIVNPNSQAMMQAYDTFRVLGGYDAQCMSYVEKYSAMKVVSTTVKAGAVTDKSEKKATGSTSGSMDLKTCIIKGLKEPAYKVTKKMLEEKAKAKKAMKQAGEEAPSIIVDDEASDNEETSADTEKEEEKTEKSESNEENTPDKTEEE